MSVSRLSMGCAGALSPCRGSIRLQSLFEIMLIAWQASVYAVMPVARLGDNKLALAVMSDPRF